MLLRVSLKDNLSAAMMVVMMAEMSVVKLAVVLV